MKTSIRLTKRAIEALPAPDPSGKQTLHWDEELKGLGVLCSGTTKTKTFIVQRKLPGGATRRVTIGAVNVLALDEARGRAKTILAEFYGGHDPKAAARARARRSVTLRVAMETYLTGRKELSQKSRAGYRAALGRYLEDWMDQPLRSITPDMVEQRHADIADGVKKRAAATTKLTGREARSGGGPATGAATANSVMRCLRAVYNFAGERDAELPANPTQRLRRQWFPVPRRARLVAGDELPAFYAAVDALPSRSHRDYLLLLLFTGLRRGEAAGLRWEEVDFAARLIRLPAARAKNRQKLDLPMSSFVRDLLVARRAMGDDAGWVFGADSRSGHLEEPKGALAQVAAAAEIVISPHDLRRTFLTVAEGTDISPMALKALVNHQLGGDVTSGYVQLTVDRLREPAQRVCDRLVELCGIGAAPEGVAALA
jgi:integrase